MRNHDEKLGLGQVYGMFLNLIYNNNLYHNILVYCEYHTKMIMQCLQYFSKCVYYNTLIRSYHEKLGLA